MQGNAIHVYLIVFFMPNGRKNTYRKSSGVAITTNEIALSSPNTSYAHRRMLRMALTAATPLFAIKTFSMTRPFDPASSVT
jgi:hypothetical protein